MTASKFGEEYKRSPAFEVPYPARSCGCATTDAVENLREQNECMREALSEAWRVFDSLGAHQSDDAKLDALNGHAFSSAAYRVRTAMLKIQRGVA